MNCNTKNVRSKKILRRKGKGKKISRKSSKKNLRKGKSNKMMGGSTKNITGDYTIPLNTTPTAQEMINKNQKQKKAHNNLYELTSSNKTRLANRFGPSVEGEEPPKSKRRWKKSKKNNTPTSNKPYRHGWTKNDYDAHEFERGMLQGVSRS